MTKTEFEEDLKFKEDLASFESMNKGEREKFIKTYYPKHSGVFWLNDSYMKMLTKDDWAYQGRMANTTNKGVADCLRTAYSFVPDTYIFEKVLEIWAIERQYGIVYELMASTDSSAKEIVRWAFNWIASQRFSTDDALDEISDRINSKRPGIRETMLDIIGDWLKKSGSLDTVLGKSMIEDEGFQNVLTDVGFVSKELFTATKNINFAPEAVKKIFLRK